MKKLFMLSLAALVLRPCRVCHNSLLRRLSSPKFAPPMIPHPIAAYIPITPEKNVCVIVPHPRRTGYESSQRLSHTAASQPCDRR